MRSKMTFQGIREAAIPDIHRFFKSEKVCSTMFKWCIAEDHKGSQVDSRGKDWNPHGLETVPFAAITACALNTEFWTYTMEIVVVHEMTITDWDRTTEGLRVENKISGRRQHGKAIKIGCPKNVIDGINQLFDRFQATEVIAEAPIETA